MGWKRGPPETFWCDKGGKVDALWKGKVVWSEMCGVSRMMQNGKCRKS